MPKTPFSINVSINIEPPEVRAEIEEICNRLFGSDRGTDETESEFLERRTEEWLLSWYTVEKANAASFQASHTEREEIKEAATIKRRKDKAPEPAEPKS